MEAAAKRSKEEKKGEAFVGSRYDLAGKEKSLENGKKFILDMWGKKPANDTEKRQAIAFGCVLGAFVGDAIGAYLEFKSKASITDELWEKAVTFTGTGVMGTQNGQVTDDSEMAMCLIHSLAPEKVDEKLGGTPSILNLDSIQEYFYKWLISPPFDIGTTTRVGLEAIKGDNINPLDSYKNDRPIYKKSTSNGCLMRITPLAVWGYQLPKVQLKEAVRLQTMFTHSHPVAIDACYLYCFAISELIKTGDAKNAYTLTKSEAASLESEDSDTAEIFKEWFAEIEKPNLPRADCRDMGYLKIAFCWAFYFLRNSYSYRDALEIMLREGGDTDTNGAIVGGLLGAEQGLKAINKDWVDKVISFNCDKKDTLSYYHYRPEFLIPAYGLPNKLQEIFRHAPTSLTVKCNKKLISDFVEIQQISQ